MGNVAGTNRPAHRRTMFAAALGSLIATGYLYLSVRGQLIGTVRVEHIDLDVYRLGASIALEGGNLYGALQLFL